MNQLPGVSVIITAYNYGNFLGEAVSSALCQTHSPVEVVIIDDGSTDNTPVVAASFGDRVRYIRQENAGLPRSRNAGLMAASHDWVVFLDADDSLYPWMIESALRAALSEEETPAVVMGEWSLWDDEDESLHQSRFKPVPEISLIDVRLFILRNSFAPTALARRSVLLGLGGFDPQAGGADDRDMWIRVAARHRFIMVHQPFYRFRLHTASMSHNPDRQSINTMTVLAKARRNPDIKLPNHVWLESEALMHFQSALNYSMSGCYGQALRLALRSVCTWPWLSKDSRPVPPALGRLRFIGRHLQFLLLPDTAPQQRSNLARQGGGTSEQ